MSGNMVSSILNSFLSMPGPGDVDLSPVNLQSWVERLIQSTMLGRPGLGRKRWELTFLKHQ